ncbi:MAG: TSUP family transporter [Planctomycetota bacterium]|jgi:uncharacterized membrane protein YfcA
MAPWILIATVFVFSTVQSLFGVGLLVFGTPTLLMLGYPFDETIAYLLPSSVLISLLQVLAGRHHITELRASVPLYCVPFIVIGLALVLSEVVALDMKVLVGAALLLSSMTRFHRRVRLPLARILKRHERPYLMAMGLVHGASNMGGGFLTIFVTTLYDDKERTRANIAYGYLVFALAQIAVLTALHRHVFNMACLVLAAVAAATYLTVGSFAYVKSSRAVYQRLITAFMIAYGVVLIGQRLIL